MSFIQKIDDICGRILAVGKSISMIENNYTIEDPAIKDLLHLYGDVLSETAIELQEVYNVICASYNENGIQFRVIR